MNLEITIVEMWPRPWSCANEAVDQTRKCNGLHMRATPNLPMPERNEAEMSLEHSRWIWLGTPALADETGGTSIHCCTQDRVEPIGPLDDNICENM